MIATVVLAPQADAATRVMRRTRLGWTLDFTVRAVPADTCFLVAGSVVEQDAVPEGVTLITAAATDLDEALVAGLGALPGRFRGALVVPGAAPLAALALPRIHAAAMLAPDAVIAVRGRDPYPVHLPRWAWPTQGRAAQGLRDLLDRDTLRVDAEVLADPAELVPAAELPDLMAALGPDAARRIVNA